MIQSLKSKKINDAEDLALATTFNTLAADENKEVKIQHVYGHSGIEYNEKVDQKAKDAANLKSTNEVNVITLSYTKSILKNKVKRNRRERLEKLSDRSESIRNYLFWIEKFGKSKLMQCDTRLCQRYISQIICGGFRPYEFAIQRKNVLYCKHCKSNSNVEIELTIPHFLFDCPKFEGFRNIQANIINNHSKIEGRNLNGFDLLEFTNSALALHLYTDRDASI